MSLKFSLWSENDFVQSSNQLETLKCSHYQLRRWLTEMNIPLDREREFNIHDNLSRRDVLVSKAKPIGHGMCWRKVQS